MRALFANLSTGGTGGNDGRLGDPPATDNNLPAAKITLAYTLTLTIDNGFLKFAYAHVPDQYVNNEGKPLMLQVPGNKDGCAIELTLGGGLNWRFPITQPAIRFQPASCTDPAVTAPVDRYKNCKISPDQRVMTFLAPRVPKVGKDQPVISNFDGVNLIVEVAQPDANNQPSFDNPLVIVIDPDIKNPGDDTL